MKYLHFSVNYVQIYKTALPVKPFGQLHLYPFIKSSQSALFKHGLIRHSLMSFSQNFPSKPKLKEN